MNTYWRKIGLYIGINCTYLIQRTGGLRICLIGRNNRGVWSAVKKTGNLSAQFMGRVHPSNICIHKCIPLIQASTCITELEPNCLNLNKFTSEYFVLSRFHRKSLPQPNFSLKIDNASITQVKSAKFLGVYIDECFTWCDHINNIKKIAKNIGILSRISYLLPITYLLSYIMP